jgi:hypothetical protein
VISIIALLAALLAPAVQSARRTARKVECLNNMRNVALAIHNIATSSGELPPLSSTMVIANSQGTGPLAVGWPVTILPAMDNSALLRNIKANAANSGAGMSISPAETVWIPSYTCPDDTDSHRQSGGLSYVVNAGFISAEVWGAAETSTFFHQPYLINWDGSTPGPYRSTDGTGTLSATDLQIALATGVFWRSVGDPTPAYHPSIDYVAIGDGTTTTLLITENRNAGPWTSTNVNAIGFGIRIPINSTTYAPLTGTTSPCGEFPTAGSLNPNFNCSTFTSSSYGSFINQPAVTSSTTTASTTTTSTLVAADSSDGCNDGGGGGTTTVTTTSATPRPGSQHAGGVNAIMVDGSGRFLSESIDPYVYTKLVTSNAVSFGELTLNQSSY